MSRHDIFVTHMGARFMGRRFACAIGRGGITRTKREGDGATPAGTHSITGLLYRRDRLRPPADWAVAIGLADLWSDAPRDADYNHMVRAPYGHSHENLHRPDPLYDIILTTNWNWPDATPGKGSAIFLHIWRQPRHPTAGCIAFARADLQWIAARLKHHSRLVIRG